MLTLGMVACNDKEDDEVEVINVDQEETFNVLYSANFEPSTEDINLDDSSLQKMKFVEGTQNVVFESSDKFGIFGVDIPGKDVRYGQIASIGETGSDITIEVSFFKSDEQYLDGAFYAVYPRSAVKSLSSDNKIIATIPTEQHPGENNSFDPNAYICCAYSQSKAQQFHFKNAISMLKVHIPSAMDGKLRSFVVESLEGSIAGDIEIEMNDGLVTNVTTKQNTKKSITFSKEGEFLSGGVDYYVCVAPSKLQKGFYITFYTDDQNYSVIKYPAVEFKKSKFATASVGKYFHGEKCWYKIVRDGQLGIDIGMVVGGKKIFWSPKDCGASSSAVSGTLYGWGNEAGKYLKDYQVLNSFSDFKNPYSQGSGWSVPTADYFRLLLLNSDIEVNYRTIEDEEGIINVPTAYIATYNNRVLTFPVPQIGVWEVTKKGRPAKIVKDAATKETWNVYYWVRDFEEENGTLRGKIMRLGQWNDDFPDDIAYEVFSTKSNPEKLAEDWNLQLEEHIDISEIYNIGLPYRLIFEEQIVSPN